MGKKKTAVESSADLPAEKPVVLTTYKGFDKDLKCSDFQYEVGKTYEHSGLVKACEGGFHACEYPLDVLRYYPAADSRFALVEQSGKIAKHDEDSKVASSSISIKAELDLPGVIKAAIEYTFSRVTKAEGNTNAAVSGAASNSGDSGAASNSGVRGAASNSGVRGAASNSGYRGAAADFSGYGKARSCAGGAIVCMNRDDEGNIRHIRASKVGENGVKPDVFYTLDSAGNFVEVP